MSEQYDGHAEFERAWAEIQHQKPVVERENEEYLQKAIADAPEGKEEFANLVYESEARSGN